MQQLSVVQMQPCMGCKPTLSATPCVSVCVCVCCRVIVHMRCYGVSSHPQGSSWLCDVCRLPGLEQPPACTLCPCAGQHHGEYTGAMKVTAEGGWCHLMCAAWVPGVNVASDETYVSVCVAGQTAVPCSL